MHSEQTIKALGALGAVVAIGAVAYGAYRVKKHITQRREFNAAKVELLNESIKSGRFEVSKFTANKKGVTVTLVEKELPRAEANAARRKQQAQATAKTVSKNITKNIRARAAA